MYFPWERWNTYVYQPITISGRMDVYYAQKIAKYVQNPEVDIRIRPNFVARCKRTSKFNVLA